MERYFLKDENETSVTILDQVFANSPEEAQRHFDSKSWVIGTVISETDWIEENRKEEEKLARTISTDWPEDSDSVNRVIARGILEEDPDFLEG